MAFNSSPKLGYHLPCLVRRSDGGLIQPSKELAAFVRQQLEIPRLNRIVEHLWLAGRVGNIHPLHRQYVLGRRVIVTEQADLHLLWINDIIFVKPLPAWLLDKDLWDQQVCSSAELRASADGFLKTYAFLVTYEVDFTIAKDLNLLPEGFTWPTWLQFVQDRLLPICHNSKLSTFAPRYTYGELRLSRINLLYRFLPELKFKYFFRGYHYGSQTYQTFLERNFAWLVVSFAYLALVLTAMQVGLATEQLQGSAAFNEASYGFTMFSIIVPLFAVVLQATMSLVVTIYQIKATLRHLQKATPAAKP